MSWTSPQLPELLVVIASSEPLDIATSGPDSLSIPASSMAIRHEELLSVEMLEVLSGEGQLKSLATGRFHGHGGLHSRKALHPPDDR